MSSTVSCAQLSPCAQAGTCHIILPLGDFFPDISNQMPPWRLLERHYFCVSRTCLSLVSFALSHMIQSFFGLFTATVYIHTCPPGGAWSELNFHI